MTADPVVPERQISRRRWWIHLVLIGGYFAAAIPFALWQPPRPPVLFSNTRVLLMASALEIIIFAIVFAIAWLASRASADDLLLKWRQGWWTVPLGVGYSIAMRVGLGIVLVVIIAILITTGVLDRQSVATFSTNNRTPVERLVNISAMQHDRTYFWLTLTVASFGVAGLREELWRSGTLAAMRKLWPNKFGDRNGQIAAVALIAIVFGFAHLSLGLVASVMAAILGLLLGIIMVVHDSIWPAVIAHGMFDATSFALLPVALEHLQRVH